MLQYHLAKYKSNFEKDFLFIVYLSKRQNIKGIGPHTIVFAFYESLHVAEQFATNFMKINQGIRKL